MALGKPAPQSVPFCHRLSTVSPAKPSVIAGAPAAQGEAHLVPCQGPKCAAFCMNYDENGKPTGNGFCADALQAMSLAQIAATLGQMAETVEGSGSADASDDSDGTPVGN